MAREARRFSAAVVSALLAAAPTSLAQQVITRMSVDSAGTLANGPSYNSAISADGRHVAFDANANNLVAVDTNSNLKDVFVHDRITGATVCASVNDAGAQGDRESYGPSISMDGRFVTFISTSTNLVSGDHNGTYDVFLRDRDPDGNGIFDEGNGVTTRPIVGLGGAEPNAGCTEAVLSPDAKWIFFSALASNLVSGDTKFEYDVFRLERQNGAIVRVSVSTSGAEGNKYSVSPSGTPDGMTVAFLSGASNLVAGDTNGVDDIFVRDLAAGVTTRVSLSTSGQQGDKISYGPTSITDDGATIAFSSDADNLVPGDGNIVTDAFVVAWRTGAIERVSVDSYGGEGDGASSFATLSGDGSKVAFRSASTRLVAWDTNGVADIFLRDRCAGATRLVSGDCRGLVGNKSSSIPRISPDGSLVSFSSIATNFDSGDTGLFDDLFVFDLGLDTVDATWTNYGTGYPGRDGVIPSIALGADPVRGTTIDLLIGNSSRTYIVTFLFVGYARADIPIRHGGDLLVDTSFVLPLPLPPGGGSFATDVSYDVPCGFMVDAQALELDPWASNGVSFTNGLEVVIGD